MKHTTVHYILIGLVVIAGAYLLVDHGQHVVSFLPFAFLLGCLVMHLFMHGSHGGHTSDATRDQQDTPHNH